MWRFRVLFWLSDKWTVICRFFKRKIKYLSPLFYWLSCDATLFRSYSCAFHNNLKPQEVNPCLKIGFRCASPSSRFIYFFGIDFQYSNVTLLVFISSGRLYYTDENPLSFFPHIRFQDFTLIYFIYFCFFSPYVIAVHFT